MADATEGLGLVAVFWAGRTGVVGRRSHGLLPPEESYLNPLSALHTHVIGALLAIESTMTLIRAMVLTVLVGGLHK